MRALILAFLLASATANFAAGADVVAINFDAASYLGGGQFSDVVSDGVNVNMGFWSATDIFGSWVAGPSSFDPYGMPANDSGGIFNASGTFYLLAPVFANSSAYTVEMWFCSGSAGNMSLIRIRTDNSGEWRVDVDSGGFVKLAVNGVGSLTTTSKAKRYEWNHIALVRDDPNFLIYHNGALVGTYETGSIGNARASGLTINFALSDYSTFIGYIDDVRIANTALSASQLGYFGDSFTVKDCANYIAANGKKTGDVNGDCKVNFIDLLEMASNWLLCYGLNDSSCN